MVISPNVLECIKFVFESTPDSEGWCYFRPGIIDAIAIRDVSDFIEIERDKLRVRLTSDGKVIAKYCL